MLPNARDLQICWILSAGRLMHFVLARLFLGRPQTLLKVRQVIPKIDQIILDIKCYFKVIPISRSNYIEVQKIILQIYLTNYKVIAVCNCISVEWSRLGMNVCNTAGWAVPVVTNLVSFSEIKKFHIFYHMKI